MLGTSDEALHWYGTGRECWVLTGATRPAISVAAAWGGNCHRRNSDSAPRLQTSVLSLHFGCFGVGSLIIGTSTVVCGWIQSQALRSGENGGGTCRSSH